MIDAESHTDETSPADDWSQDELERAYERALNALDAMDSSVQAVEAVAEQMAAEIPGAVLETTACETASGPASPPVKQVDPQITPRQVIEACLFVGGSGLTARKLASILKGDYTAEFVEETIDDLNGQYATERRPYEIRLGEGGYSLTLRDEFERIRFKAFGLGPKEVRLSQDALEVLALVAYQQPITQPEMEALGKLNPGGVLRQLLRRDLIAIDRSPDEPKTVCYVTTDRFLSLFGIGELDELPRPEEIGYK
jgi:segregation and condensation protein B